MDPEWELGNHVINELDRVALSGARVQLQCFDPRRIVDCRVPESPDSPPIRGHQREELHVRLNVVPRRLCSPRGKPPESSPNLPFNVCHITTYFHGDSGVHHNLSAEIVNSIYHLLPTCIAIALDIWRKV